MGRRVVILSALFAVGCVGIRSSELVDRVFPIHPGCRSVYEAVRTTDGPPGTEATVCVDGLLILDWEYTTFTPREGLATLPLEQGASGLWSLNVVLEGDARTWLTALGEMPRKINGSAVVEIHGRGRVARTGTFSEVGRPGFKLLIDSIESARSLGTREVEALAHHGGDG